MWRCSRHLSPRSLKAALTFGWTWSHVLYLTVGGRGVLTRFSDWNEHIRAGLNCGLREVSGSMGESCAVLLAALQ